MALTSTAGPQLDLTGRSSDDPSGALVLRRRLVLIDTGAIAVAWFVAFSLLPPGDVWTLAPILGSVGSVTLISLALMRWQRLYQTPACASRLVESARLIRVVVVSGVVVQFLPGVGAGWTTAALGAALALALTACGRAFFSAWVCMERTQGRFTRSVALIGTGGDAERIFELLQHHPDLGYRVSGLVGDAETARRLDVPFLGPIQNAAAAVAASGADGALIASPDIDTEAMAELVADLQAWDLHVQLSVGLWRVAEHRLVSAPVGHVPFLYVEPARLSPAKRRLKRSLDIAVAGFVVVLVAPVLLLAALAVKLSDGGPVLFRQIRVGRNGKPFTILKLRTMQPGAERQAAHLAARNDRDGPLFKMQQDPRVTAVGRVLRMTSLDELPQLFNVLAGSMSLVGPRPALPGEAALFDDGLLARHSVAPGVTGLWQVEARENPSFFAYRHLDLMYVENWSCALDFAILVATVPTIAARALGALSRRRTLTLPLPLPTEEPAFARVRPSQRLRVGSVNGSVVTD